MVLGRLVAYLVIMWGSHLKKEFTHLAAPCMGFTTQKLWPLEDEFINFGKSSNTGTWRTMQKCCAGMVFVQLWEVATDTWGHILTYRQVSLVFPYLVIKFHKVGPSDYMCTICGTWPNIAIWNFCTTLPSPNLESNERSPKAHIGPAKVSFIYTHM